MSRVGEIFFQAASSLVLLDGKTYPVRRLNLETGETRITGSKYTVTEVATMPMNQWNAIAGAADGVAEH